MVKLGNLMILVGILVVVYAVLGTFIGSVYVFSYIRPVRPATAVTLANSLLILGMLTKVAKKA